MQQMIFIADLIACSTCFGHHYAHHQELESIIQVVAACRIWRLVFKLSVWCGAEGCVSGMRAVAPKPDTQRFENEKERQYTYNVTVRRVHVTTVAVEKQ